MYRLRERVTGRCSEQRGGGSDEEHQRGRARQMPLGVRAGCSAGVGCRAGSSRGAAIGRRAAVVRRGAAATARGLGRACAGGRRAAARVTRGLGLGRRGGRGGHAVRLAHVAQDYGRDGTHVPQAGHDPVYGRRETSQTHQQKGGRTRTGRPCRCPARPSGSSARSCRVICQPGGPPRDGRCAPIRALRVRALERVRARTLDHVDERARVEDHLPPRRGQRRGDTGASGARTCEKLARTGAACAQVLMPGNAGWHCTHDGMPAGNDGVTSARRTGDGAGSVVRVPSAPDAHRLNRMVEAAVANMAGLVCAGGRGGCDMSAAEGTAVVVVARVGHTQKSISFLEAPCAPLCLRPLPPSLRTSTACIMLSPISMRG
jgi:hypothetical protein